jgi:hypothetical protein
MTMAEANGPTAGPRDADRGADRGGLMAALALAALLGGCGESFLGGSAEERIAAQENPVTIARAERADGRSSFFDLFTNTDDPNTTLEVNRYLWTASLEVLSFMPVAQADPFSGLIEFGYGTPPGGGRAYRTTVLIQDPALDARSLNVSMRTRSGTVSRETLRAVEDAILTRARQLRVRDGDL